ncbi:MAG: hypothetical protein Q8L34_04130 [Candidatus Woesearchaeota archaeon]|nr:hypothetical protein [Candidatus Woesearchaeota archaeon]
METTLLHKKEERRNINQKLVIDEDLYQQLVQSIKDFKNGKMTRVR